MPSHYLYECPNGHAEMRYRNARMCRECHTPVTRVVPVHKYTLVYENNRPYGIRDERGYVIFFPWVPNFDGQDDRFAYELGAQKNLAEYVLTCLKDSQLPEAPSCPSPT
jgi:hypothetical protein